jgi:twitching motility protein PilT
VPPTPVASNPDDHFGSGAARKVSAEAKGSKNITHVDELFRLMKELDASDLHLSADETPIMRIQGKIIRLDEYAVQSGEQLKAALFPIAPERNREQFEAEGDTDFAYEIPGVARFRCNFFMDRKGMGGVFRLIPSQVLNRRTAQAGKSDFGFVFSFPKA